MNASVRKETVSEGNENKAQPNLTHQEATALSSKISMLSKFGNRQIQKSI